MEVLKWAVEHGCPWNANVCALVAAQGGHLAVATWVRAQPAL
jgi:hypothetical protein